MRKSTTFSGLYLVALGGLLLTAFLVSGFTYSNVLLFLALLLVVSGTVIYVGQQKRKSNY